MGYLGVSAGRIAALAMATTCLATVASAGSLYSSLNVNTCLDIEPYGDSMDSVVGGTSAGFVSIFPAGTGAGAAKRIDVLTYSDDATKPWGVAVALNLYSVFVTAGSEIQYGSLSKPFTGPAGSPRSAVRVADGILRDIDYVKDNNRLYWAGEGMWLWFLSRSLVIGFPCLCRRLVRHSPWYLHWHSKRIW